MPFTYKYIPANESVLIVATGILEVQEIVERMLAMRLDANIPAGVNGIADLTGVERVVTSPGLSKVFDVMDESLEDGGYSYVALVVENPIFKEMADTVALRSQKLQAPVIFYVFSNIEDAEAWLETTPRRSGA